MPSLLVIYGWPLNDDEAKQVLDIFKPSDPTELLPDRVKGIIEVWYEFGKVSTSYGLILRRLELAVPSIPTFQIGRSHSIVKDQINLDALLESCPKQLADLLQTRSKELFVVYDCN